jgi:acyl carrier protein
LSEHAKFGGFVDRTAKEADAIVRDVIHDVLGVSRQRVDAFVPETGLFGSLPELDSMAVANLLTELEDRLGIFIDDDEVDGDMLECFGALMAFVQRKIAG